MTTEVIEAGVFTLAAMAYLERNDFTDICQLAPRLLSAKDGTRKVYVLVSASVPFAKGYDDSVVIPGYLIKLAREAVARIDVIWAQAAVPKGCFVLKHLMNAVEA